MLQNEHRQRGPRVTVCRVVRRFLDKVMAGPSPRGGLGIAEGEVATASWVEESGVTEDMEDRDRKCKVWEGGYLCLLGCRNKIP